MEQIETRVVTATHSCACDVCGREIKEGDVCVEQEVAYDEVAWVYCERCAP